MATPGAEEFSLRSIALPAFGPSAIWSIGAGAVLPVVALSARGLGASVGLAALFVGITTLSEFAAAIPAGVLVERIGERRALVAAGALRRRRAARSPSSPRRCGCSASPCCSWARPAPSSSSPGRATSRRPPRCTCAPGPCRRSAASPASACSSGRSSGHRSSRAGGRRPRSRWPSSPACSRRLLALLTPDLGAHHDELDRRARARPGRAGWCAQNRRVLLTVGLGVLAIGLARSSRVVVVPLWAEHVGLTAAQTSLVFAAAALVEVVLFYPAGTVMDRHGRVWVAVPVTRAARAGAGRPAVHHHARRRRRARAAHGGRQRPRARASS